MSGDRVVDRFVTILGYKVDPKGLEEFKGKMRDVKKNVATAAAQSKAAGKGIGSAIGGGIKRGFAAALGPIGRAIGAVGKWKKANEEAIDAVKNKWGNLKNATSDLTGYIRNLALTVTGTVGSFLTLMTMTNANTLRMTELARSVGVSNEFLRAMGDVAETIGQDYNSVVIGMIQMNQKLGKSMANPWEKGEVTKALKTLNLELEDLQKMAPEDQFVAIAEAAGKVENEQAGLAAAGMIISPESARLIGVLKGQGRSIAEILRIKKQLVIIDKKGEDGARRYAKAAAESAIVLGSMKEQFFGIVGEGLAPMLEGFSQWAIANKEIIRTKIAEYAAKVVKAAKEFIAWAREMVPKVEKLVEDLGGLEGILSKIKVLLIAIGVIKLMSLIVAVWQFGAAVKAMWLVAKPAFVWLWKVIAPLAPKIFAFFRGLSVVAATTIGVVIAVITLLIFIIQDLYVFFKGGKSFFGQWGEALADSLWYIRNHFEEVLDFIVSHFGISLQEIKDFWYEVFNPINDYITEFKLVWSNTLDAIVGFFAELPSRIANAVKGGAGVVKDAITDMLPDIPGFDLGDTVSSAGDKAKGVLSGIPGIGSLFAPSGATSTTNNKKVAVAQNNSITINAPQNTSPKEIAAAAANAVKVMFSDAADAEGVTV